MFGEMLMFYKKKWDLKCKGNRDFFNKREVLDNSTNTRMMLATSFLQAINDCEYFLFIIPNLHSVGAKRFQCAN